MAIEVWRPVGPPNRAALTQGDLGFVDIGVGPSFGFAIFAPVRIPYRAARRHQAQH